MTFSFHAVIEGAPLAIGLIFYIVGIYLSVYAVIDILLGAAKDAKAKAEKKIVEYVANKMMDKMLSPPEK